MLIYRLRLHLLPAMLQLLMDYGAMTTDHVGYQMMERLCLGALGLLHHFSPARYDNLRSFAETIKYQCGASALHLLHGQGHAADAATVGSDGASQPKLDTAAAYLAHNNTGMFQLDAVQGHARGSVRPGVQIHEILNFYSAALLLGSEVSWSPEGSEAKLGGEMSGVVVKKVLIAANLKMDGMLLGQGGAVHTGFQEVLGFVNPVKADEAERVLQMSDADREAWNAGNPLVSEHVEWMLTTANGAASGHCAFYFERKGGGWESVSDRTAEVLTALRPCMCCLLWAHEHSRPVSEAVSRCTVWSNEEIASGDDVSYLSRRCQHSDAAGKDTIQLFIPTAAMDSGSPQGTFIEKANTGALAGKLGDTDVISDGGHNAKSGSRNINNHKVRLNGRLLGWYQLESLYYSVDESVRAAIRGVISWEIIRSKNPYSITNQTAKSEPDLQDVVCTAAQRAAQSVPLISTIAPCRHRSWKKNTPGDIGEPMGGVFDPKSGVYIVVDAQLRQLTAMRLLDTPCTLHKVIGFSSAIVQPTDVAMIGFAGPRGTVQQLLFITDRTCRLWVLDASRSLSRLGTKPKEALAALIPLDKPVAGVAEVGEDDASEESASPSTTFWGIVADAQASSPTLFVTDSTSKAVIKIDVSRQQHGQLQAFRTILATLEHAPAGICLVRGGLLAAAAGPAIYLLARHGSGAATRILFTDGADYIGVQQSPAGELYLTESSTNALMSVSLTVTAAGNFASAPRLLAGGNEDYPTGAWSEGNASAVRLWRPGLGAFVHNDYIFANGGGRPVSGKILLLNDAYLLVARVMPALASFADAFGLSKTQSLHSKNVRDAISMLYPIVELVDDVENENYLHTGRRKIEGPGGNFSLSFRTDARLQLRLLLRQLARFERQRVPTAIVSCMTMAARMTIVLESFFPHLRRHHVYPSVLQIIETRSIALHEETKRATGGMDYSYYTGSGGTRQHYVRDGGQMAWPIYRAASVVAATDDMPAAQRESQTRVLRNFAALFKKVRQRRVTDAGREISGAMPASVYATKGIRAVADEDLAAQAAREKEAQQAAAASAKAEAAAAAQAARDAAASVRAQRQALDAASKEAAAEARAALAAARAAKAALPKKNRSSYMFFCEWARPKLEQQARDEGLALSFAAKQKELGAAWKQLNTQQKVRFEEQAQADLERYRAACAKLAPPSRPAASRKRKAGASTSADTGGGVSPDTPDSTIVHAASTVVFIKSDEAELWVATLEAPLTSEEVKEDEHVRVRYYQPTDTFLPEGFESGAEGSDDDETEHLLSVWTSVEEAASLHVSCAQAGARHYTFEQLDLIQPSMIWGTVQKVTSIATSSGDGACLGFAIGNDELEVARDQFGCAVGPPPIAVEFNEREEDVSSDPPVEDGGDDVSEAPVGVGQLAERPFGRRAAARPDYRSLNALGR